MLPKEIDKRPSPFAPVIVLNFEPLEKHQNSEDVRIPNGIEPELARKLLAKNLHGLLQLLVNAGCERVSGHRFVIEPAFECPVSADERIKRFPHILIDSAPRFLEARSRLLPNAAA